MTVPSNVMQLIRKLIEGTAAGRTTWREIRPFSYSFVGTAGSVLLASHDEDGLAPFDFRVLDKDGDAVESYEVYNNESDDLYDSVLTLFIAIQDRDRATRVDPVIKSLLDDIG